MADDDSGLQPANQADLPAAPWSEGAKYVLMTERAWFAYHSAWIICYGETAHPDYIDVGHMERARGIVFG